MIFLYVSGGHSDSEVSRRVDALTALTKSAIERVERLTSQANLSTNYGLRSENASSNTSSQGNLFNNVETNANNVHTLQLSPRKCSILKKSSDEHSQDGSSSYQHTPVSILKHKMPDNEIGQSLSQSNHTVLPVTFSPSVIEPTHKRHGILKKRSSLDESEILRRRSCSPDISFADNAYSEFRPILKNQRRSSLDEIIKRDQSPDPQPTSILKRKSSREDDREDQVGSLEPQGILKRKSTNSLRTSSVNHHVTITMDATSVTGPEILDSSEVRPILKKKHSREESFGSDPSSLEPRPILKKKSSTESDEHEEKPKKTILKCTRKNSQDECNYETELTSPKKLSMLRNRTLHGRSSNGTLENDPVRPILKQPGSRDNESRVRLNLCDEAIASDDVCTESADLFLRKRAQSVGHVQPYNIPNEFAGVLNKRRSLELTSMTDVLQEKSQSRLTTTSNYLKTDLSLSGESANASATSFDISNRYVMYIL